MSKILSGFLLLAGLVFFAFLVSPVQAVNCPDNSGDNGCDWPWTTCDDQACTQNCISTCGSGLNCSDPDLGDPYCASFQPSCPAGCDIQGAVQCNESAGNCYSTCTCDGQTVDYTGNSPGGQPPTILYPGDFALDAPATYCAAPNTGGNNGSRVDLSWSQPSNVTYYKVFHNGQNDIVPTDYNCSNLRHICPGNESFTHVGATAGTHQYYIQAIYNNDAPNNCCATPIFFTTNDSNTWSASIPDCSAPPSVSLLAKKKGDTAAPQHYHSTNPLVIEHQYQATLNWTSSNATFCQGTLGDNSWIGSQPTSSSGVDTAVLNGPSTYIYDLYCYNTKGEARHDYIQINVNPPPNIAAWIQTLLGNVHSNLRIDAPGGP